MTDIVLKVELLGGAHITNVTHEMVTLAKKLNVCVSAKMNGERLFANPRSNPADMEAEFMDAMTPKRTGGANG